MARFEPPCNNRLTKSLRMPQRALPWLWEPDPPSAAPVSAQHMPPVPAHSPGSLNCHHQGLPPILPAASLPHQPAAGFCTRCSRRLSCLSRTRCFLRSQCSVTSPGLGSAPYALFASRHLVHLHERCDPVAQALIHQAVSAVGQGLSGPSRGNILTAVDDSGSLWWGNMCPHPCPALSMGPGPS